MYFLVSDAVLLELVKTVGIIATAILSTIGIVLSTRNRKETKDLSVKVDGRLTELLEATKKSSSLEGHKEGVAEQKAEQKVEVTAAPVKSPIELKIGTVEVQLKPPVDNPQK